MQCQSDSNANKVRKDGTLEWGSLNYHCNRGDIKEFVWYGKRASRGAFISGTLADRCASFTAAQNDYSGERSFAAIADGTSNTILLSEVCVSQSSGGGRCPIKGSTALYTIAGSHDSPNVCYQHRVGNNEVDARYNHATHNIGSRWTDSQIQHSSFNTVLPPNAPSCIRSGGGVVGTDGQAGASLAGKVCRYEDLRLDRRSQKREERP